MSDDEDRQLRSTALQNIESILAARQRVERELLGAKEALERKTQELQQQREWFAVTLASIGDAVIATDMEGNITFLNRVAEAMTGWSSYEAAGQPLEQVFRIINEQSGAPVANPIESVLQGGQIVELVNHTALVCRDGTRVSIEDSAAPIRNARGEISGAVMVFHDVTRRRRAEDAMRHLAAVVESSEDAIVTKTLEGIITSWNSGAERMFGYTSTEVVGKPVTVLMPPDHGDEEPAILARLRRGERIEHYETIRRRKDGTLLDVSLSVSPLKDESGAIIGASKIVRDITQRKRAASALAEETRVLELLNSTGMSIAAQLNLQALIRTVTDAATQLSGARFGVFFHHTNQAGAPFKLSAVSGAGVEAIERLGLPRVLLLFDSLTRGGAGIVRSPDITQDSRCAAVAPDRVRLQGELTVRSCLALPVVCRSREVIGVLFLGHPEQDVFTERAERLVAGVAAQAEVAIDKARLYEDAQREIMRRERAEAALRETDRRKDEFLATLAHELRNPLAPIRQAATISKAAGATEAQKRWSHDVISRQVHHMALLIDDLLDISRITRGTLELRTEMTELAAVVDAAVETARPFIDAKRHQLSIEIPEQPVHFAADSLRLAQVLANLLTNAAKYTDPHGQIRLSATRGDDAVTISVSDTGIGIPADALPLVFQMFSQVKAHQDRSEGGLGIGLALAKGVVELHDGTIEVKSGGTGQGSEFIVKLPARSLGAAPQAARMHAEAAGQMGRRILIADDNEDAARSLAILLELEGHSVTVVNDGRAALEAFHSAHPEVLVLDIGMPDLNGYDIARQVRQSSLGRAVTLIAVTGWGQDSDKGRALAAGFNHHFTKPVEPDRLSAVLRSGN